MLIDKIILETMKDSSKKRELSILKLIKANFQKKLKEAGRDKHFDQDGRECLTEAESLGVIIKMIDEGEKALQDFKAAKREDKVEEQEFELKFLRSQLPPIPSEKEVEEYINNELIPTYKLEKGEGYILSMKDMKDLNAQTKDKFPMVNGKIISSILLTILKGGK